MESKSSLGWIEIIVRQYLIHNQSEQCIEHMTLLEPQLEACHLKQKLLPSEEVKKCLYLIISCRHRHTPVGVCVGKNSKRIKE